MLEFLEIKEETDLNNLPPNAILVTYSDHYYANSGDDIYLTSSEGKLLKYNGEPVDKLPHYLHWHQEEDDRGLISIKSITSKHGSLSAFKAIHYAAHQYVHFSDNLKENPERQDLIDGNKLWKEWFESHKISVRIAYLITKNYYANIS